MTRPTAWEIFKGWHTTEKFWMDVYTRFLSAVGVAAFIFVGAAASGHLPWSRLAVTAINGALGLAMLVAFVSLLDWHGHRLLRAFLIPLLLVAYVAAASLVLALFEIDLRSR